MDHLADSSQNNPKSDSALLLEEQQVSTPPPIPERSRDWWTRPAPAIPERPSVAEIRWRQPMSMDAMNDAIASYFGEKDDNDSLGVWPQMKGNDVPLQRAPTVPIRLSESTPLQGPLPRYDADLFRRMNCSSITSQSEMATARLMAQVKFVAPATTSPWYTVVDRATGDSLIILGSAIVLHQYCSMLWKFGGVGYYNEGSQFWAAVDLETIGEETRQLLITLSEKSIGCEEVLAMTNHLYNRTVASEIDSDFQKLLVENEKKKSKTLKKNVQKMKKFAGMMKKSDSIDTDFGWAKEFWKNLDVKTLSRNYKLVLLHLNKPITAIEIHNLMIHLYVGKYSL